MQEFSRPVVVGRRLAIDFGTSHTVAAVGGVDGTDRLLLFDNSPLLPSAVYADDSGGLRTGGDAVRMVATDPAGVELNPKLRIDEDVVFLNGRAVSLVEVYGAVLGRVRAEADRSGVAGDTVLTHPARWHAGRRAVLHAAADQAGLGAVRLLPEPVAAAATLAGDTGNRPVLVFDFGAGTLDLALVVLSGEAAEVRATDGLALGGLDLDDELVGVVGDLAVRRLGDERWGRLMHPKTTHERQNRNQLRTSAREAKETLSRNAWAPLHVPGLDAELHVTRDQFEQRITPRVLKAVEATARLITDCGLKPDDLSSLLLVGGSAKVPLVATLLLRHLRINAVVAEHPQLVVAEGALRHAFNPTSPPPAASPPPGQTSNRTPRPPSPPPAAATPRPEPMSSPLPPPYTPGPAPVPSNQVDPDESATPRPSGTGSSRAAVDDPKPPRIDTTFASWLLSARRVLGAGLLVVAVLLVPAVWFASGGAAGRWIDDTSRVLVGLAAPLLPMPLLMAGLRALRIPRRSKHPNRALIGWSLIVVCAAAFMHIVGGASSGGTPTYRAGGLLGRVTGGLLGTGPASGVAGLVLALLLAFGLVAMVVPPIVHTYDGLHDRLSGPVVRWRSRAAGTWQGNLVTVLLGPANAAPPDPLHRRRGAASPHPGGHKRGQAGNPDATATDSRLGENTVHDAAAVREAVTINREAADSASFRKRQAVAEPSPPEPDGEPGPLAGFAQLPRTQVTAASHQAAGAVASLLTARLIHVYGPQWLDKVNATRRVRGRQPGESFADERFCLAVLAYDEATKGWAPKEVRTAAAALRSLANKAAHNHATDRAVHRAIHLQDILIRWANEHRYSA